MTVRFVSARTTTSGSPIIQRYINMSQPENEKVTKNNDRLFSIYEAHLKKPNIKDYADTAAKLAAWLSDPKAYYTAARPKVRPPHLCPDACQRIS